MRHLYSQSPNSGQTAGTCIPGVNLANKFVDPTKKRRKIARGVAKRARARPGRASWWCLHAADLRLALRVTTTRSRLIGTQELDDSIRTKHGDGQEVVLPTNYAISFHGPASWYSLKRGKLHSHSRPLSPLNHPSHRIFIAT